MEVNFHASFHGRGCGRPVGWLRSGWLVGLQQILRRAYYTPAPFRWEGCKMGRTRNGINVPTGTTGKLTTSLEVKPDFIQVHLLSIEVPARSHRSCWKVPCKLAPTPMEVKSLPSYNSMGVNVYSTFTSMEVHFTSTFYFDGSKFTSNFTSKEVYLISMFTSLRVNVLPILHRWKKSLLPWIKNNFHGITFHFHGIFHCSMLRNQIMWKNATFTAVAAQVSRVVRAKSIFSRKKTVTRVVHF